MAKLRLPWLLAIAFYWLCAPGALAGTNAALIFRTNDYVVLPAAIWASNAAAIQAVVSGGGSGPYTVLLATNVAPGVALTNATGTANLSGTFSGNGGGLNLQPTNYFYVSPTGSDANAGTNWACAFLTLTNATNVEAHTVGYNILNLSKGTFATVSNFGIYDFDPCWIGQGMGLTTILTATNSGNQGIEIRATNSQFYFQGLTIGTNNHSGTFYYPVVPEQGTGLFTSVEIEGDSDGIIANNVGGSPAVVGFLNWTIQDSLINTGWDDARFNASNSLAATSQVFFLRNKIVSIMDTAFGSSSSGGSRCIGMNGSFGITVYLQGNAFIMTNALGYQRYALDNETTGNGHVIDLGGNTFTFDTNSGPPVSSIADFGASTDGNGNPSVVLNSLVDGNLLYLADISGQSFGLQVPNATFGTVDLVPIQQPYAPDDLTGPAIRLWNPNSSSPQPVLTVWGTGALSALAPLSLTNASYYLAQTGPNETNSYNGNGAGLTNLATNAYQPGASLTNVTISGNGSGLTNLQLNTNILGATNFAIPLVAGTRYTNTGAKILMLNWTETNNNAIENWQLWHSNSAGQVLWMSGYNGAATAESNSGNFLMSPGDVFYYSNLSAAVVAISNYGQVFP